MFAIHTRTLNATEVGINYERGPYNVAPTATPATISTPEDTPVVIRLAGTDPDPLDSDLAAAVVTVPAVGALFQVCRGPAERGVGCCCAYVRARARVCGWPVDAWDAF